MNTGELLNAYVQAEQQFKEVSLKAHAYVSGEPLQREWLTVERIELIEARRRQRDAAYRAYRAALGFPIR